MPEKLWTVLLLVIICNTLCCAFRPSTLNEQCDYTQIRNRSITVCRTEGTEQPNSKTKNSDRQVFVILLLVTFAFLILTTPSYLLFLFIMVVDFHKTPQRYVTYYLLVNVGHKLHTTNHGINFFLYVVSGQKFRTDLGSRGKRLKRRGSFTPQ